MAEDQVLQGGPKRFIHSIIAIIKLTQLST